MTGEAARGRWLSRGVGLVLIAAMGVGAAGCGSDTDGSSSTTGAADRGVETVKIGHLMSASGNCASAEVPAATGLQLAVDKINKDGLLNVGGKAYQIELVTKDTKSDNAVGTAEMQSLIRDEGLKIVLGPWVCSPNEPGVTALAEKDKILYMATQGSPKLSAAGPDNSSALAAAKGDAHHMFNGTGTFYETGVGTADMIDAFPDVDQIKRAYVLVQNDAGSRGYGEALIDGLKKRGITVGSSFFDLSTKDFSGFLAKAKEFNPDLLIFGTTEQFDVPIMKQAVQLRTAPRLFAWGVSVDQAKQAAGGNVPVSTIVQAYPASFEHPSSPEMAQFAKDVKAKSGSLTKNQASHAVDWYDPMMLIVQAMNQAGSVDDPSAIADALTKVKITQLNGKPGFFDPGHTFSRYADVCYLAPSSADVSCKPIQLGALGDKAFTTPAG